MSEYKILCTNCKKEVNPAGRWEEYEMGWCPCKDSFRYLYECACTGYIGYNGEIYYCNMCYKKFDEAYYKENVPKCEKCKNVIGTWKWFEN